MSQEHVRLTFLVLFALYLGAFQGCQKPPLGGPGAGNGGSAVSGGETAGGEDPTPEEARGALIHLVETFDFQSVQVPKESAQKLKSKESIDELKKAKIYHESHRQGEQTYIGSWICNLPKKRFLKQLVRTRGSSMDLEGRFERGPDRRWKAIAEGYSIADFAPR